mmetsp:Transcript_47797/g.70746  ORF Transcript_47797/g.70746 Transcript_47797/m.70746 type:complete len:233 (+) Transcript_47797:115-813(+)|eukprot:CAMPEP_0195517106 /NCGR_PEP_ID=MMETSP0794_2-20130614/9740_1 /TAXON_ID=515487 /ORGANISM="Stephanopyxis turris, Strain CCMP 815" /LENGTH=232 /DNA_ID=CAMNT_0040645859 /DNA_START=115 /DNA_END=813 /DNA_ORIENTATION=+
MTEEPDASQVKNLFDWPPLESNPEIFTEYMHKIGLSPAFAIGEVFGFDEELLAFLPQPIYGTIVALDRLKKEDDKSKGNADHCNLVDFYMDQSGTLDNACGIIACIHAALNTPVEFIQDSVLDKFAKANKSTTAEERCKSLENNTEFKTLHAGFASQGQSDPITSDQKKVSHHFIAFVVKNGQLIELDGTKKGPHVIGPCDDVLRGSIAEIQSRLAEGSISDRLSMMTLNSS